MLENKSVSFITCLLYHLQKARLLIAMETFSSVFQRTSGKALSYERRAVYPIFRRGIRAGVSYFRVTRIEATASFRGGLRVKVDKGSILLNGQRSSEMILWSDNSPEEIVFAVELKKDGELKAWNVWESGGVTNAWIGNAGMIIEEYDNSTRLICSGGTERVDFTSLVIEIEEVNF